MKTPSEKPLIIAHAHCADGFTAAWAATRHSGRRLGPDEFDVVFAKYQEPPPDVTGRDVLILDFSYPRETLIAMHETAASLLVIDHHRTAREALRGLDFCIFDMSRSGAGLAWDELSDGEKRPRLIDYIEDRDLWKFDLPESKAVSAYISVQEFNFEGWDRLAEEIETDFERVVFAGKQILKVTENFVARTLERGARFAEIGGYRVPCVNLTFATSEVLHAMTVKHEAPFAASWFESTEGDRVYSLRAHPESGIDVGAIAAEYGGGGHPGAAGFVFKGTARNTLGT